MVSIKRGLKHKLEREWRRLRWNTECDYSVAFQASSLGVIQPCAISLLPVHHILSRITLGLLCLSTTETTLSHLCVSSLSASCPAAVPLKRTPLKCKQRRWKCRWTKHLEVLCSKALLLNKGLTLLTCSKILEMIRERTVTSCQDDLENVNVLWIFHLLSFSCTYLDRFKCVHSFGETKSTHNSWGLFLKCQPACWQDQVAFCDVAHAARRKRKRDRLDRHQV